MSEFEWFFREKRVDEALNLIDNKLNNGQTALIIHDQLYPDVQYVINPPFINPHLPKMHRICRDFYRYLTPDEAKQLIKLEVSEYVRRDKIAPPGKYRGLPSNSKDDLLKGIEDEDRDRVANVLASMRFLKGKTELVNTVMTLCSGYMGSTLGHSVSCTAFILQEYLYGTHDSDWPTNAVLADYLCKGNFSTEPEQISVDEPQKAIRDNIIRAVSGTGIESLHDIITIYSIQAAQPFVSEALYSHLVASWLNYLDDKTEDPVSVKEEKIETHKIDYSSFKKSFVEKDASKLTATSSRLISSAEGRKELSTFIIKCLCDDYKGNYNPHFFTGLGSLNWVLDSFYTSPTICKTALYQYLDFIFSG